MNLYKPISERGKGREWKGGRGERERKAGTEGRKEKREGVEERESRRQGRRERGREGEREKNGRKEGGRERERTEDEKDKEGGRERGREGREEKEERDGERKEEEKEERERNGGKGKMLPVLPSFGNKTSPNLTESRNTSGDSHVYSRSFSPHGFLSFRKQLVYAAEILQVFKMQASREEKIEMCCLHILPQNIYIHPKPVCFSKLSRAGSLQC